MVRQKNDPPRNAEADSEQFLNELQPHTLEYFEMISYSLLGPRSIRAMGTQLNSLVELKLTSLSIKAIAELPSLPSPPVLKVLVLTDSLPTSRNEEFYSIVSEVAGWISSCKSLRRLELRRFVDDPKLLSQALTDQGPHLTTLSLANYTLFGSRDFYEALPSQQSLQNLYLRGEGSENPDENSAFVQAIGQLKNLRELELKDISDGFRDYHAMPLILDLPRLERLWISGSFFDDAMLDAFLCLPQLKSLVIYALSEFRAEMIIEFISRLGPSNKGFNLSILNSTVNGNLSEEEQTVIHEMLKNNLNGSFDFALAYEESTDDDSEDLSN
ncbi:hypothetical protein PHISCL_01852 [Aspergillus sclerotialis]|uniref:Uncharacterized protein n=1 Tax=Aspergillus sclerotialis TaxID=2070753 RepID=A0A3A2ZRZ5_9EURO|nr:hypothetical protein PHISCL_01852 [Aspergillus sclerotialis]